MAQNYYNNDRGKKKKLAIIGFSSIFLVAMVIAVIASVSSSSNDSGNAQKQEISSSMKAIQAICQPTDYKDACVNSLTSKAGNTTDPKDLVQAAFASAMEHLSAAAKNSTLLQELNKDPRASQALQNCEDLVNYAIDDLKKSFNQVGDFDYSKMDNIIADIKIWLSAVITYQETCLDGFENTTGDAGEKMRQILKTSMELSSNGLAIVGEVSSILSNLQLANLNRRLLSDDPADPDNHIDDEFPYWSHSEGRKLLQANVSELKPNLTVAKDGSGDFKTINEAIRQLPKFSNQTFILYIKKGIYEEQVQINKTFTNLMMVGDGPTKTKITGSLNFVDGTPTFKTATVAVLGDGFIAKGIGFENSAGAAKHQAVALRVQSDRSIFYNCQMDGYQDTLYTHTKRQFYRDCTISGTIDFIFGDAAVIFQNCTFVVRKPLDNQQCIVTAQGRKERRQPSAIIIQNSTFTADPEYYPYRNELKSYLGRPWKEFSRTIIMESYIEDLIQPSGWLPWAGDFALRTCFYTEFRNRGPGAKTHDRVKWRGIKTIKPSHAIDFAPGRFLSGDRWIPSTGVPYNSGLFTLLSNVTTKSQGRI